MSTHILVNQLIEFQERIIPCRGLVHRDEARTVFEISDDGLNEKEDALYKAGARSSILLGGVHNLIYVTETLEELGLI